jgi:hypothetical protein
MLAPGFRGFSPLSLGLVTLYLWQRSKSWKEHMVEEAESPHGSWEERDRKGWESHIPFESVLLMT